MSLIVKQDFSIQQRIFNKSKGTTGNFISEEDQTTQAFGGMSPLTIEYDSRNNLPSATACNLQFHPSINLSMTSKEN